MDRELAQYLEGMFAEELAAYAEAWQAAHPAAPAAAERCGGGWMVFAGAESPVTQAVGLGMTGPVADRDIDRLESFFVDRGATARVSLCPFAENGLVSALGRRGFAVEEFENVLVRRLDRADVAARDAGGAGHVTVRAVGEGEAAVWRDVIARGMLSLGPEDALPVLEVALSDTFRFLRDTTCYLAWMDGRPVGGDCLAVHGDVASLFGSATLPAARGRGVQATLLAAHVRRAASLGCRLLVAGAAPGGVSQRNMERQGFEVAYTEVMLRKGGWPT